jgi:hypothetical protein
MTERRVHQPWTPADDERLRKLAGEGRTVLPPPVETTLGPDVLSEGRVWSLHKETPARVSGPERIFC